VRGKETERGRILKKTEQNAGWKFLCFRGIGGGRGERKRCSAYYWVVTTGNSSFICIAFSKRICSDEFFQLLLWAFVQNRRWGAAPRFNLITNWTFVSNNSSAVYYSLPRCLQGRRPFRFTQLCHDYTGFKAKVVALPEAGKDPKSPLNLLPISLLPSTGKLFEKFQIPYV
jgi:hypothetical protein